LSPRSQEPVTCPYTERDTAIPRHTFLFLQDSFNIILPSMRGFSKWPFLTPSPFIVGLYTANILRWRSQWPRSLRRRSAAARPLRSWVRIQPGAWMFVCCECCVLSGRGLCDELVTRQEESYRLWCVFVCDLETSRMRRP
jgi:hypothetical protein